MLTVKSLSFIFTIIFINIINRLLIEYGANTNAVDKYGKSALGYARDKGFDQCVKTILGSYSNYQRDDTVTKLINVTGDLSKANMSWLLKFSSGRAGSSGFLGFYNR